MSKMVNVKYDNLIRKKTKSWLLKIDTNKYYFPCSLCILEEDSKIISCPEWLIINKELEAYIDE